MHVHVLLGYWVWWGWWWGFIIYFLPSIIAAFRAKPHWFGIFILNLLLGWTIIGWIVALVWSLTSNPPTVVQRYYRR